MSFQPAATVAVIGLVSVNHSARVKAGDASKIDNETLLSTDMCSLVSLQSGTLKTRLMRKLNTHCFLVDQWGFGAGGPQIRTPSSRSSIPVSLADCSHLQKSKLFSDWLGQTDKLYAFLSHLLGDKTLTFSKENYLNLIRVIQQFLNSIFGISFERSLETLPSDDSFCREEIAIMVAGLTLTLI